MVDPTTGSVRVFINVEEGQNLLRPGQFVKAQVEVARHENTIVLPKEAVVYEDGAPIAYMVKEAPAEPVENQDAKGEQEDGAKKSDKPKTKLIAERRELTVGFSDVRVVEVTEGVTLGEQVITIGNHTLEDNSPITLEINIPKKEEKEEGDGSAENKPETKE